MVRKLDDELKPPFNFTTPDLYWLCDDLYSCDWEKFLADLERRLKAPTQTGMDVIFSNIRRDIVIIKGIISKEGKTLTQVRLKEVLSEKGLKL